MHSDSLKSQSQIIDVEKNDVNLELESYLSMDQLLSMDPIKLEFSVFKIKQTNAAADNTEIASSVSIQNHYQYIQFKIKEYKKGSESLKLLQIIDVTNHILYTEFKAKN